MKNILVGVLGTSLILVGCSTTGGAQKSAVDQAMGKCVITVGGGALLGAIIGNNIGSGDASTGAIIGGLAGAGVCGFILNRASKEDKERIRQLELAALETQQTGRTVETFVATNGYDKITVATTTSDVDQADLPKKVASLMMPEKTSAVAEMNAEPANAIEEGETRYTNCRYVQTDISVASNTMSGKKSLTCRTETGDWETFSV